MILAILGMIDILGSILILTSPIGLQIVKYIGLILLIKGLIITLSDIIETFTGF